MTSLANANERVGKTPTRATYAPRLALREITSIAIRSSTPPKGTIGTYFVLARARARGSAYAPTPYGETCVDDDYDERAREHETIVSAMATLARGANAEWAMEDFSLDDVATSGALRSRGEKYELRVYYAQAKTRAWRRGSAKGEDILAFRAVIDLENMIRIGDRVPSSARAPTNAVFVRARDGVYSPAPANDSAGDAIRAYLHALNAWSGKRLGGGDEGVASVVIDRVVVDGDDVDPGWKSQRSKRSEQASPRSTGSNGDAAQAWARAEKGDVRLIDVKACVANVVKLIDARRAMVDARELRDELARRLAERLGERERFGVSRALDDSTPSGERAISGVTADELVGTLTKDLADAREGLGLMKEDIGRRVRALRQAGDKLVEANDQLDAAESALNGPNGIGKLYQKQRALVARRWRLVGELADIFRIEAAGGTITEETSTEYPLLKIADVPLDLGPAPSKVASIRAEDIENDAAAYGYVAQILIQLAAILDVRLRYPVCPAASRSYICDFHQVTPQPARGVGVESRPPAKTLTRIEFPLFMESPNDRAKYTYGVFLLNKNLEQLLNAHGLSAVGARHTLQNLERIFDARNTVIFDGKPPMNARV